MAVGSVEESWRSFRIVGYIWKYLGLHNALCKRRMTGQDGGPWRGTKVHVIYGSIYQLIGEVKWAKTWIIIKKWLQRVTLEEPLDYK